MDDRRFTEDEVKEILARAVESRSSGALTRSEGLSLADLKAIGEEAGIDPIRVEEAARSVAQRRSGDRGRFFGGPTSYEIERSVEGSFEDIPASELRAVIRRTLGEQGEFAEDEGWLEWSSSSELGFRFVSLTQREDRVSISASANLGNLLGAIALPGGIIGTIFTFLSFVVATRQSSAIALGLGFVILPVVYALVRTIFGNISRSQGDKLEQVVEELTLMAAREE